MLLSLGLVTMGCDTRTPSDQGREDRAPATSASSPRVDSASALRYVTLPPELDRVLRDYERGWRAKDAPALAALFAEDGFVLAEGQVAVRGRAAITRAYTGQGGPLVLRALAASTSDTLGWIIGTYTHAETTPDDGKFVLALRRVPGGRWEISADIDNGIRR
jgi:ketosteroid isomerase-like protein